MADYRDFIPEGEDLGGLGSGFKDFVPAPEPKPQVEKKETDAYPCDQCDFVGNSKISLLGHSRKHKS